jgi:hypothetical protein
MKQYKETETQSNVDKVKRDKTGAKAIVQRQPRLITKQSDLAIFTHVASQMGFLTLDSLH